jgi:peptide chain release factor 2
LELLCVWYTSCMDKKEEDVSVRIKEIESAMCQPDFWHNPTEAQGLIAELQTLQARAEGGTPYDKDGAVLSIYAGAGGDDAEDFAGMLFTMYRKYCEKEGWESVVVHEHGNDHGGYRNVSFEIPKKGAYGKLRNEYGVHRLVRISPFNASSKRHTSFALVEVLPIINTHTLDIPERDLDVSFARSSGPGGQNVNKRETAVRLTHTPTGVTVHVDGERTQEANREKARAMIEAKLLRRMEEERKETLADLSQDPGKIEWGSQIRSYVLHPYQMVKDHRSGVETGNVKAVLQEGEIDIFLEDGN